VGVAFRGIGVASGVRMCKRLILLDEGFFCALGGVLRNEAIFFVGELGAEGF